MLLEDLAAAANGVEFERNREVEDWRSPPEILALGGDDVHVWRVGLKQNASLLQSLLNTLAADEQARAGRFLFQVDRERFIVARGALRAILSSYLKLEAARLSFVYSSYGKPALAEASGDDALRFNVSHADEFALVAVTREREIGVDVERINADVAQERIAEQFFSPGEVVKLRSLPSRMQSAAFFRCWTRKEAYIKARGEGLSLPLDTFDVSLLPGEAAALLSVATDSHEAARWSLRELRPGPGYVATLAVKAHDWHLQCWQWEG